MNSKKVFVKAALSAFMLFAASSLSALEVNRNELQSTGSADTVVFRNYSGPHSVINTIEEIRQIGSGLGNQVKGDLTKSASFGNGNRYQVIHAVDPSTVEKMDADIFIIGKNASVDHITNLRRIISAYLSAAYGYSNKDADTIATFVTVYNAVYRGNMEAFTSKYKDVVTKNLSADKAGLSTNYEEWPGKSQIIIPLSDITSVSTVDTSLISDKKVIDSMQGEDDKGVDARKGMVDIKERESDEMQEDADAKQKAADAEKARLAEEQKKLEEANKAAAQAKADAEKKQAEADKKAKEAAEAEKKAAEAKKAAEENPSDTKAQEEAAAAQSEAEQAQSQASAAESQAQEAQSEADTAQQAAQEQAEKTEEQSQAASQSQAEADSAQQAADEKRSEAQEERAEIAKDQNALLADAEKNSEDNVMYGLKNVDDAGIASAIVKMNVNDGSVVKESPVTVVRGRTVYEDGDAFIAVAGSNIGSGAVRLVAIDKTNLEIVGESAEKLSEFSALVSKDGNYYCTIQDGSDYYIGKYNNSLQLQNRSQVKVKAATPITVTEKGVVVTDSNSVPVVLNPADLSSISPASSADNRSIIQRTASGVQNITDAK
ncbi:MAG: hypothetical protein K5873_10430 [Treponema sp.]|nr:hypothetical protein [Treponema sp.]